MKRDRQRDMRVEKREKEGEREAGEKKTVQRAAVGNTKPRDTEQGERAREDETQEEVKRTPSAHDCGDKRMEDTGTTGREKGEADKEN